MSVALKPIVPTDRFAAAHAIREAFYRFGPKRGHDAYVSVAHLLAAGTYGSDRQWLAASGAALAALAKVRQQAGAAAS